ncbi:ATP-binding cassette domain-containing protein [Streptomyces sp. NPDC086182]|uniref:ATP-binding cassette domain-containing protein n=1 Tax=Streptomyces sp. NPDC086182 TaxID=3155058 RepID=UPI0034131010
MAEARTGDDVSDREAVVVLRGVNVRRHTSGQVILSKVDWTVRAGEHWALLGANGAGKTTLLRLDEPFNALDLPSREDLVEAMQRLARSRPELATVTVTHHLEELSPAVSHTLLPREGRVLAGGPVAGTLTDSWMTSRFGRPVTVVRHEGRCAAYSSRHQGS